MKLKAFKNLESFESMEDARARLPYLRSDRVERSAAHFAHTYTPRVSQRRCNGGAALNLGVAFRIGYAGLQAAIWNDY